MSEPEGTVLALPALPPNRQLVVTTDSLLAEVHFPLDTRLEDLAHKALAVNLSDLAAMGATALAIQVQVHGPPAARAWREHLLRALRRRAAVLGLGHRVNDAQLQARGLTVLALGSVKNGCALTRHGARAGDDVWVSGTLGDAGAGLELVMGSAPAAATPPGPEPRRILRARLDRPEPRLALGQALVGLAHSAIDLSDGLIGDLGHIVRRSRVSAQLWVQALPLSPQLLAWAGSTHARELALCAGDDYELCFTAPPAARQAVAVAARHSATPVCRVGRILPGRGLRLLSEDARPLPLPAAYQHFQDRTR